MLSEGAELSAIDGLRDNILLGPIVWLGPELGEPLSLVDGDKLGDDDGSIEDQTKLVVSVDKNCPPLRTRFPST